MGTHRSVQPGHPHAQALISNLSADFTSEANGGAISELCMASAEDGGMLRRIQNVS